MQVVVVEPFGPYGRGDVIADEQVIASVLAGEHAAAVVRVGAVEDVEGDGDAFDVLVQVSGSTVSASVSVAVGADVPPGYLFALSPGEGNLAAAVSQYTTDPAVVFAGVPSGEWSVTVRPLWFRPWSLSKRAPVVSGAPIAPLPQLSVTGATINEAAGTATFTVSLSWASAAPVAVGFTTVAGTATQGQDYTAASGVLTFPSGSLSQAVTVSITDDSTREPPETFSVVLSSPSGATIATASAVATIRDDGTGSGGASDDTPSVAVNSPTVSESAGFAVFTVSLSNPSAFQTSFALAVTPGTATPGDYGAPQYSLDGGQTWAPGNGFSLPPGALSALVRVPVLDDAVTEGSEAFSLTATRIDGVTTNASATGSATITDNDAPVLSIADASTINEAAGTVQFTVSLSSPSAQTVTVFYSTSSASAAQGADYTAASGTLTFAPGVISQSITVNVTNDATYEGPESFGVSLSSPSGATIGDGAATATITDDGTGLGGTNDDRPIVTAVSSPSVTEGAPLDFVVSLSNPSAVPVPVSLALATWPDITAQRHRPPAGFIGLHNSVSPGVIPPHLSAYNGTVRTHDTIRWAEWEPSRGQMNFGLLDQIVNANWAAGKKTIITFFGCPQWAAQAEHITYAQANASSVLYPGLPTAAAAVADVNDAKNSVRALLVRYGDKLYGVEMGNEPSYQLAVNSFSWATVAEHVAMCAAIYSLKSEFPTARFLSAGYAVSTHLNSFVQAGGGAYVDEWAWHPYGYHSVVRTGIPDPAWVDPTWGPLSYSLDIRAPSTDSNKFSIFGVIAIVDAIPAHAGKPLRVTEIGIGAWDGDERYRDFMDVMTEAQRRGYWLTLLADLAAHPRVTGVDLYEYGSKFCGDLTSAGSGVVQAIATVHADLIASGLDIVGDPIRDGETLTLRRSDGSTVTYSATGSVLHTPAWQASGMQASADGGLTWVDASGGSVTAPPGVTGITVRLPTINDALVEPAESVAMRASAPANAAPASGIGSIASDDVPGPSLTQSVLLSNGSGSVLLGI